MGFTGPKALEFKCAFYDEFTRMEDELSKNFVKKVSKKQKNEPTVKLPKVVWKSTFTVKVAWSCWWK